MLKNTSLHAGWEFIQTDLENRSISHSKAEWLPAQVPGHIHLDLVQNGIIADPFVELNELGCQWVDNTDWSYRITFDWSPDEDLPKRELRFEGLDTICTISLNGSQIGRNDNMFVPLAIDVTASLKAGQNEIRIDFQSAVRVGNESRAAYLETEGMPADQVFFFDRSFVRKAQYMYGWDWGPRLVSCGIWRPVTLVEYQSRLIDVHVTYERPQPDVVVINLVTQFEGEGVVVHALQGAGALVGDGQFVLKDPEIWSPEEPNTLRLTTGIYPLGADLDAFEIEPDLADDESIPIIDAVTHLLLMEDSHDVKVQKIGICEVELLRVPDSHGESFEFVVNGRRLWARGANWIPDHSFPSVISRERLRQQLERCIDMGFNMLRIWGGGLYESDDFYELCDEMGILVWQDFPFACAYYPDNDEFRRAIADEAYVNIQRLRNHPSLAIWCGNNENHEMYFNSWGGIDKRPKRYYGEPIYEETLPQLLAKLDPARPYVPSSPIGNPPNEKEIDPKRRGPNADGYGDQHNWDVWHGRGDWRFYTESKGRFSSEFGFSSSCGMPCWQAAGLDPNSDYHGAAARWHDKTGKGHDTFVGYVKLHYPESVTLEDWVYYSQLNQRDALRHGIEHYRRSEFCRGTLIWQLNDCWPVQSWAALDSLGEYKALAYELRRLYSDMLLSIERKNETVKLFAVNDGEEAWFDVFSLRAFHTVTGELLREWEVEAELESDSRGTVIEVDVNGLNVNETLLLGFAEDDEAIVWRLLGEPKATRFPTPEPLIVSTAPDRGIKIRTTTPLVDLMLTEDGSVGNLLENFLTLPQAGVFEVGVRHTPKKLEARSLAGRHQVILTRSPI